MRLAILGFAGGAWLLQRQSELPGAVSLAALLMLALGLALWIPRNHRFPHPKPPQQAGEGVYSGSPPPQAGEGACSGNPPPRAGEAREGAGAGASQSLRFLLLALIGALIGSAWAAAFAHWRLADALAPQWEGKDLVVTGVIASLPQPFERGVRFEFDVEQTRLPDARVEPAPSAPARVPQRVTLAWYNGLSPEEHQEVMPLKAGERWRFTVRLRRPHGLANPHGFDYEAWLLERGIRATGSVRARGVAERLDEFVWRPAYALSRLREAVRERFWDALPDARYAGVLIALAVGDQGAIEPQEWQVFARTGVSHLMSISGLHVTMISGLVAWLVFALWSRAPRLALRLPAHKAAAAAGFAAALDYCLISGFAVPAQRTLYMVGVVALALWLNRAGSASRVLALALAAVLALDPWAVLSPGFWLSFGAVALIFYIGAARPRARGWLAQWLAVQWAVTVGLAPLLLILFQQVSIVSPIANAVAIPLVSFAITPLALIGAVLPLDTPLVAAHLLLELLMPFLHWLSRLEGAVWQQHAPAAWTLPLALAGAAWLLAPRGVPIRALGAVMMLPMFAVAPAKPEPGEVWLTVLDVGQGMAVVARTRDHVLLYDVGPAWSPTSDGGTRAVIPFLRGEGIARVDAMLISHDDTDHSGGAESVLKAVPVGQLISSLTPDHPIQTLAGYRTHCWSGHAWEWDGVRFSLLHPQSEHYANPWVRLNERSCVVRIAARGGAALLAGDIERRSERELLAHTPDALKAEVLLVPHHGSGTSSLPAFVEAVSPRYAVFAVGYLNRFGHPRPEVVRRYVDQGSAIVRSDLDGAFTAHFGAKTLAVSSYRESARRYWHGR